ncbi:DUF4226 domain-containing protein, partial [Nocardia nova]|uniref:DUF4226 domain-containing protein n=1 Tax=Nocardia nova TaxID=37330 RepID=UPI0011B07FFD
MVAPAGSPAVSVAPGSAQAPPAAGAGTPPPPAPATDRASVAPEPEPSLVPGIDDHTLAQVAPTAMMGGAMALSMLPMLASALSGLAGGTSGGNGNRNGSGATTTGDGSDAGLSPQAQKAIAALKKLAAAYGDENSDDPDVAKLRTQLGTTTGSTGGTGTTAGAVKARQLFQRNAATAFNTLDNDLYNYIYSHAGKHKVDKTAVRQLLRDVDAALAELGPTAYTKAGQQKVHHILTIALTKAQAIVSGGNTNSTETATEINRLTNQYLYNIYGKKYP